MQAAFAYFPPAVLKSILLALFSNIISISHLTFLGIAVAFITCMSS